MYTSQALVVFTSLVTLATGYSISNPHTVYYKGQYINTRGAAHATSLTANRTAHSVYRNFYTSLILRPEIEEIDLTILLDSSMSMGADNYRNAKYLLSVLIAVMKKDNFRSRIRVAMYTFSESLYLTQEFEFEELKYRELIRRRILSTEFHNVTYTHLTTALYWMDSILQRECRTTAKKVLIVATDGNSNDDSARADGRGLNGPISDLSEHNIETYVVAVGESIDLTKVAVTASAPDGEHIFHLNDTNATLTILNALMRRMESYYHETRS